MHAFSCETDYNERSGEADDINVMNYYGGDSYEEAIAGTWSVDTLWKQDSNPATRADSYKSSKPDGQNEQKCAAYREISVNRQMSAQFKWGHTYRMANGFSIAEGRTKGEWYRKDGE